MAVEPGTRFGSYEVCESIGRGGMGEVYRATDTELKRDAALKVLPPAFVEDADRLARFRREAEILASLNHPNIAQVYGLARANGQTAIAMELVEGPTLDDRIREGPIPPDETLGIALQIIAALEAAHDKGIVHRDLKPANVKVRDDGTVKVLDFGISKPIAANAISGGSPVMTTPAVTETGVILGTAAYMSPEQARGRFVDQRTDIWALGCLLFEMLTGQPVFGGHDVMMTLARVLDREADLNSIPGAISPAVRNTIGLCLTKDPEQRISHVRDVRLALQGRFESVLDTAGDASAAIVPLWRRIFVTAGAVIAGALLAVVAGFALRDRPESAVTRFTVDIAGFPGTFEPLAISPDGRRIVYVANDQLYSHRLDQEEATALPGTSGATSPFFPPDGERVAFFSLSQLQVAGFSGELPRTIADFESAQGVVGAWSGDGRIIFGRGGSYGLLSVAAVGGTPELFADIAGTQYRDFDYPDFLPGNDWVIFTGNIIDGDWSGSHILARNLTTGEQKIVLEGGFFARYIDATGHLVFIRNGTLHAAAFDPVRVELTGPAVPLIQDIDATETGGNARFAIAGNGTLIYMREPGAGGGPDVLVVSADRAGNLGALSAGLRNYERPRVSPDGTRVAIEVANQDASRNVWVLDLATGDASQLSLDGNWNWGAVWTPDSEEVLYTSNRDGAWAIYRQAADGSTDAIRVVEGTEWLLPSDVLADSVLLYQDQNENRDRDIMMLNLDGDGVPVPFLATDADERSARISPDGSWIVYVSEGEGLPRLYARRYPDTGGGTRPITDATGLAPVWSATGDEIYYMTPNELMAVPVRTTANTLTSGQPEALFSYTLKRIRRDDWDTAAPYDTLPDGRFIAVNVGGIAGESGDPAGESRPQVHVVLNWFEELQRLVPND